MKGMGFYIRSIQAYDKISKSPDEFTPCARKKAFMQYVRSIEKHTFNFHKRDIKHFEDWHTQEFSSYCRFVYIFLDHEDRKYTPLYIGKTHQLAKRIQQHSQKEWFKYANELAIEVHFDDNEASGREAQLIKLLTPLFNRQNGLGMSFKDDEQEILMQVPIEHDVTNLDFLPIKESVKKYENYGAVVKYMQPYKYREMLEGSGLEEKDFTKSHLNNLQHLGNKKLTKSMWEESEFRYSSPYVQDILNDRVKWHNKIQEGV